MAARKYALGLDFGTESARALVVAVDNGEVMATVVAPYPDGVIDGQLPGSGIRLEPDWALQNPHDYIRVLEEIIPRALRESGLGGEDVIGIGTAFTASTLVAVDSEGTPLCMKPAFRDNPHAWVKLWKHHAAQPEADRINELARDRQERFLQWYGGRISSESFFPKALELLDEAPEVYDAADRLIEAGDWLVLLLCGEEKRNACAAGYKALWNEASYPGKDFLKALHPRFENVVDEKMGRAVYPVGTRAGGLLPDVAKRTGMRPGTAVAVAGIDGHTGVPGVTVTEPGKMALIMGTSIAHMVCCKKRKPIDGICGVVKDGILPGYYGFEAGQTGGGDILAWFVDSCVPSSISDAAAQQGADLHGYLSRQAARLEAGESGMLALDWWNGNRSVLADADLTGLLVGMTLATTPVHVYRALLESVAFGTYKIIKTFEQSEIPVTELYAGGGLAAKNPLLLQIFADVTNRAINVSASDQTAALGAAMWGAVAAGAEAGGYNTIAEAAAHIARLKQRPYKPKPKQHAVYEKLFVEYERLHDLFGRGGDHVMKTLKEIRLSAQGGA